MSSYQTLNNINWDNLPIDDFRKSFFIKIYAEKLNLSNPFFIQARIGTVFSCANEISLYLNSLDYNKNMSYIKNGAEELIEAVETDEVIKAMFQNDWEFYKNSIKKCVQDKDISSYNKIVLNQVISFILSLKGGYEKSLLSGLKDSIFSTEFNPQQKDRILTKIEIYTSKYITFLLENGFSHLYLYNRLQYFTRVNNYGDKDFESQFDSIFNKISNERSLFLVYFLISDVKNLRLIRGELNNNNINILESVGDKINKNNADKIRKVSEKDKYIEMTIQASDYMAASLIARKNLDKIVDIQFYSKKIGFMISDGCVVKSNKGVMHYISMMDINKKIYNEDSLYSSRYDFFNFNMLVDSLDSTDRDQVLQSLRYVRLARNINSNEQKILNLWISLESLFLWKGDAAILTILLQHVPKIYAQASITCRLDLALKLIKQCNKQIYSDKRNSDLEHEDRQSKT